MRNRIHLVVCAAGLLFGLLCAETAAAKGHDFIVTGAKPDKLYVIDAQARKIVGNYQIPGANDHITTIVPSPDGRIAYVLVNRMESIVGIELKTGRQVFRADLSTATERVKDFFAFTVTPNGKELIAYELPTRLEASEYQVEEPRFVVFKTAAGLHAKPVRTFAAPRRIGVLLARPNGRSFYAIGFDLYEYDLRDGHLLGSRGVMNWQNAGHAQPDLLAFWPVTEPSGTFSSPIYSEIQKSGEAQAITALMTLDIKTGELAYRDFEPTTALIFSTVLSPDKKHAFGTYTTLTKVDVEAGRLEKRVNNDHTYYSINMASDGSEIYAGGAMCDIAFYDAVTLARNADLALPGCADQALATLRVVHRR
jgi:quinohemoprotein amine dehydrogenase beta subunit